MDKSSNSNKRVAYGKEPKAPLLGRGRPDRNLRTNTPPQHSSVRTGESSTNQHPNSGRTPQYPFMRWWLSQVCRAFTVHHGNEDSVTRSSKPEIYSRPCPNWACATKVNGAEGFRLTRRVKDSVFHSTADSVPRKTERQQRIEQKVQQNGGSHA